jgi:hypothetical protein
MTFLRKDRPGEIPARPLDAKMSAAQRRVAKMDGEELLMWADNNVSQLGKTLSDFRRGDVNALEEARMAAQAFLIVLDELAFRLAD